MKTFKAEKLEAKQVKEYFELEISDLYCFRDVNICYIDIEYFCMFKKEMSPVDYLNLLNAYSLKQQGDNYYPKERVIVKQIDKKL